MQMSKKTIKIGISIGDINGVGIEVALKAFQDKRMLDFCTPIFFANHQLIDYVKKTIGLNDIPTYKSKNLDDIKSKKINIINSWSNLAKVNFGKASAESGKFAFQSLKAANQSLKQSQIDALVTAPINKNTIQSEAFSFPGHTEYLEHEHEGKSLMLMLSDTFRLAVVTGHIPLEKVPQHLSKELILEKLNIFSQSLRQDFGVRRPKIAILGLNPHAGDNGLIGKEEQTLIIPAIQMAEEKNILAFGPYSADSFFNSHQLNAFDGILAMYHDQGLIPFKTISFGNGVNFTAGLDIVRTSPDHGTAFDIAGKNTANESSFRHALFAACDIVKKRQEWQKINSNSLPVSKSKNEKRLT